MHEDLCATAVVYRRENGCALGVQVPGRIYAALPSFLQKKSRTSGAILEAWHSAQQLQLSTIFCVDSTPCFEASSWPVANVDVDVDFLGIMI